MAVWTAKELKTRLAESGCDPAAAYLVTGERYLCQQAVQQLEQNLTAKGGTVHAIDGEEEDPARTINRLLSLSLLPGRQVYRVTDTRLFHSKNVAGSLWKRALDAHRNDRPEIALRHLSAMLRAAGLDPAAPDSRLDGMNPQTWKKTFGFTHPGGDLKWADELLASRPPDRQEEAARPDDAAGRLQEVLEAGIPAANILILTAEEVDRRKKLYRYFKEKQVVIDLSVESGHTARAKKAQKSVLRDLARHTLQEMRKTMDNGLLEELLERVGFHPVAVVMETEKLCLHAGDRKRITRTDLEALVGRLGQDALFELTTAVAEQRCASAMVLADRLMDNGVHPLALLATLRNHARALLLFRSLQADPDLGYTASMSAAAFQKQCLPALKEKGRWQKELGGHPFAVYMQFKTAARFSPSVLGHWLRLILRAERRLKGSSLEPATVIHQLLAAMLISRPHGSLPDRRPGTGTLQNRSRGLQ